MIEPDLSDLDWSDPYQAALMVLILMIAGLFKRMDELEASLSDSYSLLDYLGIIVLVSFAVMGILGLFIFRKLGQQSEDFTASEKKEMREIEQSQDYRRL